METRSIKIAPSILAANLAILGKEVEAVTAAGADFIHIDIMDGHFVPNITFGSAIVKAIRAYTHLPLDVHLMIAPVDPHVPAFAEAGADILTLHPEAGPHLHRSLHLIKSWGMRTGVALNPATPIEMIRSILPEIDLILVMTVDPGFGGQALLPFPLEKVKTLRRMIEQQSLSILLEVDGGVNAETAAAVINAGADILVSGKAIFGGDSEAYASRIHALRYPSS